MTLLVDEQKLADAMMELTRTVRADVIEECAKHLEGAALLSSNSIDQAVCRHAAEIVRALASPVSEKSDG